MRPSRQASKHLLVVAPARGARPQVLARGLGPRGEQLVVEVAPAELADERLGALALERAGDHLAGRDAAEVEIGREPGGRVGGEVVRELAVAREPVVEPRLEPPPAGGLAARRQLGRERAVDEVAEQRQPPGREAVRQGEPLGGGQQIAARLLAASGASRA